MSASVQATGGLAACAAAYTAAGFPGSRLTSTHAPSASSSHTAHGAASPSGPGTCPVLT